MKWQVDTLDEQCWFFHKWRTEKEEGITKYQKCKKCKSKRIIQDSEGYQPVDWHYLEI